MGATMLMAAMASLPTPCPTNAPSVTLSRTRLTIPTSVGQSMRRKSLLTLVRAKSMASRSRKSFSMLFIAVCVVGVLVADLRRA